MMKENKSLYWKLCIAGVVLLSVITFTPLVMPTGISHPMLFGMPRTLWSSILIYFGFVFLTWIGTRVYPGSDEEGGEDA